MNIEISLGELIALVSPQLHLDLTEMGSDFESIEEICQYIQNKPEFKVLKTFLERKYKSCQGQRSCSI